jgi:putative ABC transport system permease protein
LQRALVKQYPNVTCADMTQLIRNIDELIGSAAAGIRFFAGLCILSGLLLMGSALWNSRYERQGEHALLRTLGARGSQVVRIALTEYFLLGLFASLTGSLLGLIANWGIGRYLFEIETLPGWEAILMPLLALPALTVLMGLLSHPDLGNRGALNVLKAEG